MLEKYCDILVIGTELPGLVTAAFLARRGLSVQVIDSDLFAGHPKAPDPVCLTNKQSRLLRSILGRLNVPEMSIQNFLSADATLQVIFPKNRIDVLNNPLTYFEEIEREFPSHFDAIKIFYENQAKLRHKTDVSEFFQLLLPSGWRERRSFKKFIQQQNLNDRSQDYQKLLKLTEAIACYFTVQFLVAYQLFADRPFAYQIAELFNPGDGEIFSVHAGVQALKKILKDRIVHYDGAVREKIQVNRLLFRNGVFEGAELDAAHGSVLSKYVIWNGPFYRLSELLPRKWRFRKLRKAGKRHDFDFHWFTARYTVDTLFIPDPMHANVLVVREPGRELVGDNFLYLQVRRSRMKPRSNIDVHFLLPGSALKEEPAFFESYFSSIKEQLVALIPFCEKSLKREFPIENNEQPADTLFPLQEDDFQIFKHSARMHGVSTQTERSFLNLFKHHYKTPAPNLYVSHPSIFRGFGLESKLILGLKITDLIWQEVEKIKKRAMKTERRIA